MYFRYITSTAIYTQTERSSVTKSKRKPESGRMIHIRLTDETHKRLRVRAAELDTSIQSWVEALIEKNLKPGTKKGAKL